MSATLLNNIEAAIGGIARGFASAPVQLGTVTLQGVEVPSELVVSGQQQTVIHKLPGGDRVINSFGADPAPITLAGMFTGPNTASRYQALDAMRIAGAPVQLLAAGLALQAVVTGFRYTIRERGAVVPYELTLEVVPQLASVLSTAGTSVLSGLIGSDAASALTSITSTIGDASAYVAGLTGQATTILGDAVPVASLVGAGGPLAAVSSSLTAASALTGTGASLAGSPAALGGFVTAMQGAGSGLMTTIAGADSSIAGIAGSASNGVCSDAASLQEVTAQAGILAGATQAGGYVNRALAGASSTVVAAPVVYS